MTFTVLDLTCAKASSIAICVQLLQIWPDFVEAIRGG